MRKLIWILMFMPLALQAQLVTNVQSPGSLVQNTLLGPGVTVSNINFSGTSSAIGYFNGQNTNLGLDEGIVITTGTVAQGGSGPHGPNNSYNAGVDNGSPGYSALSALIGGSPTKNAAILEFDFVPYSDTVRFRYVFGSEEYPEFVGSEFNDVFAFFISGPGIAGGVQNMARLPGGQVVAINNVNNGSTNSGPCTNCANYINNGDGSTSPNNSSSFYIQYDGFTKVLEAVSRVQCGQTYHLVIAIADAVDGIYDSGIFLEANSLSSKVPVEVDYAMSFDAFNDGETMAEGCVSTTVTLTRGSNNSGSSLTIPISVTGTATSGADYTAIPASVTFNPGQTTATFSFNALADGLTEGVETVNMIFQIPDPCGNINPIELNLKINDIQPVEVDLATDDVICPGQPIEVIATPSGGVGPYTFIWNTGETSSSIFVSPATTQTYSVSVTDDCLGETATGSITVTVPVFQPFTLATSPNIVEICPYISRDLVASPAGGAGAYTYQWMDASGAVIGTDSLIAVAPASSTQYTVIVTDLCGNTLTGTIQYTITSPPLVITVSPDVEICPWQPTVLSVSATGGYGAYFYFWEHSGETTSSVTVSPNTTTTYTVRVYDECQTFFVEGEVTVTVIEPTANFEMISGLTFEDLPVTFQNLSTGAVTYEWDFGDGQRSNLTHPSNTYDLPGQYEVTLIATNYLGCKDTVSKFITIQEEYWVYVPNTFTPDGNEFNNTFFASTIKIKELTIWIYNRWGENVFKSNDVHFVWDGTYDGFLVPDGTYTYKIRYQTNSGIEETIVGHINVLK